MAVLLVIAGCSSVGGDDGAAGPVLAFETTTTVAVPTTRPRPSTTADPSPPVPAGTPEAPFAPLPEARTATAVVTPSGVVLPVVPGSAGPGDDSFLVVTPCADVRFVSGVEPLGRAHVILDPGHGGREPGAAGAELAEKDLNLAVAQRTAERLRALGATVVLTRSSDITVVNSVRATLARTVDPALFVSIHHNGGAPPIGDRPGTIVYTKAGDDASRRLGGLAYDTLTSHLAPLGRAEMERRAAYVEAASTHEQAVAAYDRSLADRDAALVANGQVDPTATTLPPDPVDVEAADYRPSSREAVTTSTVPAASGDLGPVPVPDTVPLPPPFEAEHVPAFRWSGSGNAGVRSWVDGEGRDYLTVLRRSGDVPAALVEFLYLTNPSEEALLADEAVVDLEAAALADAVITWFGSDDTGSGFVADETGDHDIGGGGRAPDCVDADLGLEER